MSSIKILFYSLTLFGATFLMNAQNQLAYIDLKILLKNMPETKEADEKIKKNQENFDIEFKRVEDYYQKKLERSVNFCGGQLAIDSISSELNHDTEKIQKLKIDTATELQKKSEDLQKPILDKARTAIQKVARTKGIQYVLDSSVGSCVIMADGTDLLEDVKKELASMAVTTETGTKK